MEEILKPKASIQHSSKSKCCLRTVWLTEYLGKPVLTVVHKEVLGDCCNEKQKERTASKEAHMRKDTGKSREEASLTVSETGNAVLFLGGEYGIIRACVS